MRTKYYLTSTLTLIDRYEIPKEEKFEILRMFSLQATLNLDAINRSEEVCKPWRLTFCYGRALQGSALTAWQGCDSNYEAVHAVFAQRVVSNSKASMGQYQS